MTEVDGVILVNKPAGISSAGVVRRIKKIHKVYRIGHAGSLDPFATGLLVCCINRATRLSRFFLSGDKKYRGVLNLGAETDTQDLTGTIIRESDFTCIYPEDVERVASRFNGYMYQIPPVYSALKHKGAPLYKLARKGIYVNKPARSIVIHDLVILDINFPEVSFEIHCSSGTYVRTVCADIGRALGCGGYLKSLHRVASSNFFVEEAYDLEYLERNVDNDAFFHDCVLPMTDSLSFMLSYTADRILVKKIRNGVRLGPSDLGNIALDTNFEGNGSFFKVIDSQGELVCVLDGSKKSAFYDYCCVF